MQREAAIREPLILGHKTYKDITDDVVGPIMGPAPLGFFVDFVFVTTWDPLLPISAASPSRTASLASPKVSKCLTISDIFGRQQPLVVSCAYFIFSP